MAGGRRLPDGVFNVVYGGREAVTAIVEHPDIRAIQFVGSTAVGRYVYEEGTRRGKRVGSFTSAKNAMLVLPDADMEMTADAAVAAGYGSAGERCMAQTLVIAVGDTAERLRPLMEERIAKLKVGPGMEPGMDMGPMYTTEHRERRSSAGSTGAAPRGPSSSSTGGPSSTPRTPTASSSASPSSTT